MSKKDSLHALELSIVPAVLASSCCLTIPALALLGISFGENIFLEHRWLFRFLALVVLLLSLVIYFYKQGVTTKDDFIEKRKAIVLISIQTIVFACVFYVLFLQYIVPLLCQIAQINTCQTII